MRRVTSALLLGAAVLLLAYVNAPAAPVPPPARMSSADLAAIEAMAPLAGEVAQEAERLRARLAAAPVKPVPQRDPFRFGAREEPSVPAVDPVPDTPEAPVTEATAPGIAWPTLVAILTSRDPADVRTGVLATGDHIDMVKVGEAVGDFVVRAITATSVELEHVATSSTTRLTVR